jgi:FtsH-binding integral membrane protein
MTGAALAFPNLFARLGGALLGVLIGLLVCEIVLLILGRYQTVTDWIAAGLFSLYIGFDVYRSQQFAKTVDNAVDCALDIYLDIANLFIRLLQIMGKRKD